MALAPQGELLQGSFLLDRSLPHFFLPASSPDSPQEELQGDGRQEECASASDMSASTSVASSAGPFPIITSHGCDLPWSRPKSQPWAPVRKAGSCHLDHSDLTSLHYHARPWRSAFPTLGTSSPSCPESSCTLPLELLPQITCMGSVLTSPGCLLPTSCGLPSGAGPLPLGWLARGVHWW